MSVRVKQIKDLEIEERLRKSDKKEDKEVLQYIQALKNALKGQQEVTRLALKKLREYAQHKPTG